MVPKNGMYINNEQGNAMDRLRSIGLVLLVGIVLITAICAMALSGYGMVM